MKKVTKKSGSKHHTSKLSAVAKQLNVLSTTNLLIPSPSRITIPTVPLDHTQSVAAQHIISINQPLPIQPIGSIISLPQTNQFIPSQSISLARQQSTTSLPPFGSIIKLATTQSSKIIFAPPQDNAIISQPHTTTIISPINNIMSWSTTGQSQTNTFLTNPSAMSAKRPSTSVPKVQVLSDVKLGDDKEFLSVLRQPIFRGQHFPTSIITGQDIIPTTKIKATTDGAKNHHIDLLPDDIKSITVKETPEMIHAKSVLHDKLAKKLANVTHLETDTELIHQNSVVVAETPNDSIEPTIDYRRLVKIADMPQPLNMSLAEFNDDTTCVPMCDLQEDFEGFEISESDALSELTNMLDFLEFFQRARSESQLMLLKLKLEEFWTPAAVALSQPNFLVPQTVPSKRRKVLPAPIEKKRSVGATKNTAAKTILNEDPANLLCQLSTHNTSDVFQGLVYNELYWPMSTNATENVTKTASERMRIDGILTENRDEIASIYAPTKSSLKQLVSDLTTTILSMEIPKSMHYNMTIMKPINEIEHISGDSEPQISAVWPHQPNHVAVNATALPDTAVAQSPPSSVIVMPLDNAYLQTTNQLGDNTEAIAVPFESISGETQAMAPVDDSKSKVKSRRVKLVPVAIAKNLNPIDAVKKTKTAITPKRLDAVRQSEMKITCDQTLLDKKEVIVPFEPTNVDDTSQSDSKHIQQSEPVKINDYHTLVAKCPIIESFEKSLPFADNTSNTLSSSRISFTKDASPSAQDLTESSIDPTNISADINTVAPPIQSRRIKAVPVAIAKKLNSVIKSSRKTDNMVTSDCTNASIIQISSVSEPKSPKVLIPMSTKLINPESPTAVQEVVELPTQNENAEPSFAEEKMSTISTKDPGSSKTAVETESENDNLIVNKSASQKTYCKFNKTAHENFLKYTHRVELQSKENELLDPDAYVKHFDEIQVVADAPAAAEAVIKMPPVRLEIVPGDIDVQEETAKFVSHHLSHQKIRNSELTGIVDGVQVEPPATAELFMKMPPDRLEIEPDDIDFQEKTVEVDFQQCSQSTIQNSEFVEIVDGVQTSYASSHPDEIVSHVNEIVAGQNQIDDAPPINQTVSPSSVLNESPKGFRKVVKSSNSEHFRSTTGSSKNVFFKILSTYRHYTDDVVRPDNVAQLSTIAREFEPDCAIGVASSSKDMYTMYDNAPFNSNEVQGLFADHTGQTVQSLEEEELDRSQANDLNFTLKEGQPVPQRPRSE